MYIILKKQKGGPAPICSDSFFLPIGPGGLNCTVTRTGEPERTAGSVCVRGTHCFDLTPFT